MIPIASQQYKMRFGARRRLPFAPNAFFKHGVIWRLIVGSFHNAVIVRKVERRVFLCIEALFCHRGWGQGDLFFVFFFLKVAGRLKG